MAATRPQLLKECSSALKTFLDSSSAFRIIRSVPVRTSHPSAATPNAKTLFILDSSFNPPSRAHASLAVSALASHRLDKYPKPHRLLLLFSTHNADKGATPAAFEHRLAMMIVFAEDLAKRLSKDLESDHQETASTPSSRLNQEAQRLTPSSSQEDLAIDIALTTKPYYNDKSTAIEETRPAPYPSSPQHIHITGFDTITRIFNPKYYPDSNPPLSALTPFFAAHGLRVTVRPDAVEGENDSVEKQLSWVRDNLTNGRLNEAGARSDWAEKVEIVQAREEGQGVSSTKIREAVKAGDWGEVESLCSEGVAGWVREFGLYSED